MTPESRGPDNPDAATSTRAGTRIMIVEDEVILAEMTRRLLLKWGYEVVDVVATGEKAVERARELKPDLIVMDVRLAGAMDGIEAARQINAEQTTAVLFTTGYSDQVAQQSLDGAVGPAAALTKPATPQQLQAKLRSLMRNAGLSADERTRRMSERGG